MVVSRDDPLNLHLAHLGAASCAFERSPLTIEAHDGRHLNVTLLDFTGTLTGTCQREIGHVTDVASERAYDVCTGVGRHRALMTSTGSRVRLTLRSDAFQNVALILQISGELTRKEKMEIST